MVVDGDDVHAALWGMPVRGGLGLLDSARGLAKLELYARARRVPAWITPQTSAEELMHSLFRSDFGRRAGEASIGLLAGVTPAEFTAGQFLDYVRAAGSVFKLLTFAGGAQDSYFEQGAGAIADGLAEAFTGTIHTDAPVTEIRDTGTNVEVIAGDRVVECRRVVVAAPPPQVADIAFTPTLDDYRARLYAGAHMGRYTKIAVIYRTPWWRDRRRTGTVIVNAGSEIQMIVDATPHRAEHAALAAFSTGRGADLLAARDEADRAAVVVDAIESALGPAPEAPELVREQAWASEPHLRGAPAAVFAENPDLERLRRNHGRVHWAGTDLALAWRGYMDGAVGAGRAAADEVAEALRTDARHTAESSRPA
ncbi:putative flavin-containing amine oxidase [Gordonia soli NBRC 108243]|uniref:Putative flavin-containing amine oxidase n=1 Tax=Gordonia soli NBRC 108243 TaxID=1223545 RepID=M0QK65_9ACTN|nr:putative flavin-containing amine oxidase [Gordonia soli NBRC 108243]